MKLYDLINHEKLKSHLLNGLVSLREHPTSRLGILNYTHKATYEKAPWGDGTIDWCRGLIFDIHTDEIVALPFKKFHNLNTIGMPETMYENLPWGAPYTAAEKVDGSLGIYYKHAGVEGIATRGSFTSSQALFATRWMKENIWRPFWPEYMTPLFEIVYPENRIVVDYNGWSGLVLLGMMNRQTGDEVNWPGVQQMAQGKMKCAHDYSGTGVVELAQTETKNIEGFVVTFQNGLKLKIKTEESKRLHRIMMMMNPRTIWESLRDGKATEIPGELPESFQRWYRFWTDKLQAAFYEIYHEAKDIFFRRPNWEDTKYAGGYRADCANYFKSAAGDRTHLLPVLFGMFDGKDFGAAIWKQIEPRGDDQSFKTPKEIE